MTKEKKLFSFEIIGECHAKGRPRFRNMGKYVQTYTDDKTTNYENLVKLSFINSECDKVIDPSQPISAVIDIYQRIPSSFSKTKIKNALEGTLRCTKKPDLDNCIKSILDALNGVGYVDDKQIVEIQCRKHYASEAKTVVTFYEAGIDWNLYNMPFTEDN